MTKILVIEDEKTVRKNILELLEHEGFDAIAAENGSIGINIAQEQMPDLILCDVMMPEMDGYSVLTALRDRPATASIPFIFLTAKSSRADQRVGMELGADDYLTKPFTCQELVRAIAIRLSRQAKVSQLQQKIQELQELNILKDDLINTVSHDLRTPLANMKLAIKLLNVASTAEQRQRYLSILQAECAREINLVNNLLDLQRLESHTYKISLASLNLPEWLPNAIAPFQSRTQERQQIFKVEIEPELPEIVTDPDSLDRILAELLNNACKYTPIGSEIYLKVVENALSTTFVVSNQVEIPVAALPHLFEKFYRVAGADFDKQGGTGLGLALVQKLVEQLHGTIEVNSENGWTQFTITLPKNQP